MKTLLALLLLLAFLTSCNGDSGSRVLPVCAGFDGAPLGQITCRQGPTSNSWSGQFCPSDCPGINEQCLDACVEGTIPFERRFLCPCDAGPCTASTGQTCPP